MTKLLLFVEKFCVFIQKEDYHFCIWLFVKNFDVYSTKKRLSQNETAFFCVCKKIGQVLTSLSQNLPVSLIFCILGSQVKISQR